MAPQVIQWPQTPAPLRALGTLSIAGKAFTVTQAGSPGSGGNKPVIRAANGVVNGASFLPGIVPGSFATIFGTNLASTTTGKN